MCHFARMEYVTHNTITTVIPLPKPYETSPSFLRDFSVRISFPSGSLPTSPIIDLCIYRLFFGVTIVSPHADTHLQTCTPSSNVHRDVSTTDRSKIRMRAHYAGLVNETFDPCGSTPIPFELETFGRIEALSRKRYVPAVALQSSMGLNVKRCRP